MSTESTDVRLEDRYEKSHGKVVLNGSQALTRLPILQAQADRRRGLNTAGYISGYPGSPLGGYDLELRRAKQALEENHIVFQPGVNEDLAATAILGTQQLEVQPDRNYDGVFSIWYGKGPGLFRSGDAIRHGAYYGASANGGVLVAVGDDHQGKSSTMPYGSELDFASHSMPYLYPSNVQEIVEYGLYGFALSRYCGAWIGLKLTNETMLGTATVDLDESVRTFETPQGVERPTGTNFRPYDAANYLFVTERMHRYGRPQLAQAFAKANPIDRIAIAAPAKKLGIVAAGVAYQTVRHALDLLGIDETRARDIGLSLYKVGMAWPLQAEAFSNFVRGHAEILFIEEKHGVIENQARQLLFHWPEPHRPRLIGKTDEAGAPLLDEFGELGADRVAATIAARLTRCGIDEQVFVAQSMRGHGPVLAAIDPNIARIPYFCSGCPHNRSTTVPDGSMAMAGTGCHAMVMYMNRSTDTSFVQMGGEAHNWLGLSHFVKTRHRIQNLGDGTYCHSGLLALFSAASRDLNVTYKILFNDAISMTGGQPLSGRLTVPVLTHQVSALGARRVAITTDDVTRYRGSSTLAPGTTVHDRRELDSLQREFREISGVTVIIHDQTCAAEKRRRRKRGLYPDPPKRAFINQAVCDACGDCARASNCLSVDISKTEFGNKRRIDQSSCNKDFSCVEGFCPSFVTVHGGKPRKAVAGRLDPSLLKDVPAPVIPMIHGTHAILVNGVGGTGVVTVGAVLAMAAHIDGKFASTYDMSGLAQKGGAVQSHIIIANSADAVTANAIGPGEADLILGCDLVVTTGQTSMEAVRVGHTRILVNTAATSTAALQFLRDFEVPVERLVAGLVERVGDLLSSVDATTTTAALVGSDVTVNMFLVGFSFQKGWLPISERAILKAIELNGASIETNKQTFGLGRVAAHDWQRLAPFLDPYLERAGLKLATTLEDKIARRVDYLTRYQSATYARRYVDFVTRITDLDKANSGSAGELSMAVAENLFKLMAYKDEYEVARLYSSGEFAAELKRNFEGDFTVKVHLSPPLLARPDRTTGVPGKMAFGSWIFPFFNVLARLRGLRGTAFDPFGRTAERRLERRLIDDYRATIGHVAERLTTGNYSHAVAIARVPAEIRGYGHVKLAAIETAAARARELQADFDRSS